VKVILILALFSKFMPDFLPNLKSFERKIITPNAADVAAVVFL
jgi:hypothetical protein